MEETNFKSCDLSAEDIKRELANTEFSNIFVLETVNSTNIFAKELAIEGANHNTIVIANHQTAGRGRLGREFFSPAGFGLYMSIIVRPDKIKISPSLLTVAAGVAVCRAVNNICGVTPQIKWVNDIFLNGKKVCGILAEAGTSSNSTALDYIIVGIGLNITTPEEIFPGKLKKIAGSISSNSISRNRIAAEIINNFDRLILADDAGNLIEEYKGFSLILGKKISFARCGETFAGTATDINSEGNLIVKLESGETVTLKSGEVSLGSENFL